MLLGITAPHGLKFLSKISYYSLFLLHFLTFFKRFDINLSFFSGSTTLLTYFIFALIYLS